jgi:hypothetical protein
MTESLIAIHPLKQFVTDEEIAAMRARQEAKAAEMGALWILHPTRYPKSKKQPQESKT